MVELDKYDWPIGEFHAHCDNCALVRGKTCRRVKHVGRGICRDWVDPKTQTNGNNNITPEEKKQ